MADINTRPNIRIEIKNNVNDIMDIDKEAINISEDEEGEIIEKNGEQEENNPNTDSAKSGNIWAKFDNHTTNANTEIENQIESVYTSLCVKELRDTVRLDAVHMRQNGEMNTLDILKYFVDYSPTAIEWIDEKSCNILWADQIPMAAKALYHLSKVIVGSKDDGTLEETMDLDGQNNGMLNKHRIIEMKDDDKEIDKDTDKENREIHIRNIMEDIPEGTWRLGNECLKCKIILLRFALTIDKQPIRAEHFTEYYKQCGVIENGNNFGIISQSRKRKFQGIFDRNRDLTSGKHAVNKDPWGTLAECWNQDYAHTESEYKPTTLLTSKHLKSVSNLHHRLGFKHAHLELNESEQNLEDIDEEQDQENLGDVIEVRSDIEDTIALTEHNNRELLEKRLKHKVSKKKRSKIPRMRMYADEEEAKIKRKKSLQSLKKKKHAGEIVEEERVDANDLRNMLGKRTILKPRHRMENVVLVIKQEPDEDKNTGRQMEDLGNKLKHRHLMRLSEAAAKNSVHLRSRGIHRIVNTAHRDEETYGMQAPVPETLSYRHSETAATIREISTARLVPRAATLHSDSIIKQSRLQSSMPMQQRRMNAVRSPDCNQQQFHYAKDLRSDRNHHQRVRGHMDRDQRSAKYEGAARGKMHADREEYYQSRSGTRCDSGGNRRKYRKNMEEDEIEKVERKGAKSKVMVVVKKLQQPSVASMAILPSPSSTANPYPTQPTSISTSSLRHRRHDNMRLTTRDSNRPSSNSRSNNSSEEDDSSSSSSSSSSEDDNDDDNDGSSSESGSGSDESSDSSASVEITRGSSTVVRGGRGSIKDRVGIKKKDTQPGRLRVQIKNEHYGK